MQITTILGLVVGIGGILLGNVLEGGTFSSLFQMTAAFIVFGGTVGATVLSNRMEDIELALGYLGDLMFSSETSERKRIASEIIESALLARRESILTLEARLTQFHDPFMRSVYRFVIDGVEPEILRRIFEEE